MGIELVQLSGKLKAARGELSALTFQVQQRTQENDALRSALDKADDAEFIKDLAREQLGYIESNGRLFIDVHGSGD